MQLAQEADQDLLLVTSAGNVESLATGLMNAEEETEMLTETEKETEVDIDVQVTLEKEEDHHQEEEELAEATQGMSTEGKEDASVVERKGTLEHTVQMVEVVQEVRLVTMTEEEMIEFPLIVTTTIGAVMTQDAEEKIPEASRPTEKEDLRKGTTAIESTHRETDPRHVTNEMAVLTLGTTSDPSYLRLD